MSSGNKENGIQFPTSFPAKYIYSARQYHLCKCLADQEALRPCTNRIIIGTSAKRPSPVSAIITSCVRIF